MAAFTPPSLDSIEEEDFTPPPLDSVEDFQPPPLDSVQGPTSVSTTAQTTGYHPVSPDSPQYSMEGGNEDKKGNPVHTLDSYLRGESPYVTIAGDPNIPYGTPASSPAFPGVPFRVNDTGGAFKGAGLSHFDIARDNQAGANSDVNNRPAKFDVGMAPEDVPALVNPRNEQIRASEFRDQPAQLMNWVGRMTDAAFAPGQESPALIPPETAAAWINQGAGGIQTAAAALQKVTGKPFLEAEKAIEQEVANTASSFTQPESVASLLAFAAPGVAEAYAVGVLAKLPEQFGRVKEAIQQHGLISAETATAATQAGIQDLMGFLATKGALKAREARAMAKKAKAPPPTTPQAAALTPQGPLTANPLADMLAEKPEASAISTLDAAKRQQELVNEAAGLTQQIQILKDQGMSEPSFLRDRLNQINTQLQGPSAPMGAGTTGIANRVLAADAAAGVIDEIASGKGMSWTEMVDLGREKLNQGANPQEIANRFARTKRISPTDFAVLRAERERLAVESNQAAEVVRANPGSPQAQAALTAARAAETAWIRDVVQPAKTATSDIFRGMQGEAPIDATTFEGLRRAVLDSKHREPTPKEARLLQRQADKVKLAKMSESVDHVKLQGRMDREFGKGKVPTLDELRGEIARMAKQLTPCK